MVQTRDGDGHMCSEVHCICGHEVLIMVISLLSMGGSESFQIPSNISSFVFRRLTGVLRVWNNMRVSN